MGIRVVFQKISVSRNLLRGPAQGGLPNPTASTMGRSGLPPHSQVSRLVTKMSPEGGGSCWGSTMGTLTPKGAGVVAGLLWDASLSREWP